mmetsp:Transcript_54710/g.151763  ORF Transcript_54710/g.151763 Transcript_54710/m.151763 type:complete len:249 (-) Transcript_54710:632-1378(-)
MGRYTKSYLPRKCKFSWVTSMSRVYLLGMFRNITVVKLMTLSSVGARPLLLRPSSSCGRASAASPRLRAWRPARPSPPPPVPPPRQRSRSRSRGARACSGGALSQLWKGAELCAWPSHEVVPCSLPSWLQAASAPASWAVSGTGAACRSSSNSTAPPAQPPHSPLLSAAAAASSAGSPGTNSSRPSSASRSPSHMGTPSWRPSWILSESASSSSSVCRLAAARESGSNRGNPGPSHGSWSPREKPEGR